MTIPMPEPIGYFACDPDTLEPVWDEGCVCQDNIYNQDDMDTVGRAIIFKDQAEAYADARVAESRQWISVEDRLPEPETDVLVKCSSKFGRLGFDIAGLFRGGWMSQITEADCRGVVTHWMPLPAPPLPGPEATGE